jgi:hypothetical protein
LCHGSPRNKRMPAVYQGHKRPCVPARDTRGALGRATPLDARAVPSSSGFMSSRVHHLVLAGVIGLATFANHAPAQVVRTLTVTADVADMGVVASVAPLQLTGDGQASTVSGTVSTKHNGPYHLQVRLTSARPDTILARSPDGSYVMLGTGEWTTVASGPGGINPANRVEYRIRWANGGPRPPDALAIPVTYRVVLP